MLLSDQAAGLRALKRDREDEAFPLRRANSGPMRTIAITSGKGGVGKTQVAANLAVGLARAGNKVVLLDADLGLASLDLVLGVHVEDDIRSVLSGARAIDDILVDGPEGVKLLPACPGRYEMANLGPKERAALLDAVDVLSHRFDFLIIDTGAGIGSNTVAFAAAADDVLVVTTPEPTALRDGYAMIKVLARRCGRERIHLVANQVMNEMEGVEVHERLDTIVRQFLSLELVYLGCIPRDEAVRHAVTAGEPFVLRSPTSVAARAAQTLVRRLGNDHSQREHS
jgi:flagellar biosynthesis protein FlhG